jgi:hypothetical protein
MSYKFLITACIFFINACSYSENDGILVKKITIDDNQNVGIIFVSNVNYREKKGSEVGGYIYCEPSKLVDEKNNLFPDSEKKSITGVIDTVNIINNSLYGYNVFLEKNINYDLFEYGSSYTCQRFTGSMSWFLKKSEKFKININN